MVAAATVVVESGSEMIEDETWLAMEEEIADAREDDSAALELALALALSVTVEAASVALLLSRSKLPRGGVRDQKDRAFGYH